MARLSGQDVQKGKDAICLSDPIIHQICEVSGTPGLAIGVFGRKGKIFDHYYGYRDISKKQPPDVDTVFNLGSMCKGFTALAVACLVADGKMTWDDHIDTFLGELRGDSNGKFTIRDLLSHRTGLCRSDALFIGSNNQLLLTKTQGTEVFACLEPSRPPRQEFIYNNFGYHAVGCAIERVSSMNYGDFLAQRIFKPLGMNRTFTKLPPKSDENIAEAYVPYYNLELRQVSAPRISDDTVAFAAGCIRSCMRDLLVFYSALLYKFTSLISGSVFEDFEVITGDIFPMLQASMPLPVSVSFREQSYGMGWARTQLPNQMSELSGNSGLLDSYPTIGNLANAPLVLHHGGNNIGCSSSVYMIPELEIGIVVLGNALGHCDAANWTAQVLTEAHLFGAITTPYCQYASSAAEQGRSAMKRVQAILDREKKPCDPPTNLKQYTGIYWHKTHQFHIVVTLSTQGDKKELSMLFQDRDDEKYTLRHYHQDTFVFNETFDQLVNRGQWRRPHWFYKIEFLPRGTAISALRWQIDDTQEQGEIFSKFD
ncbi:beta-lactamase/transpeptidase-like protein [Hypoxylon rubiginosum]|uniref:Beta-lactamase/transpeptidase-like protein n=1 Tax=Hypoxylon rubiginosum TaxID=110542 RepID=A0ACC0CKA2_9PEZI|nr:beta-lactamase/transpeptidase-like protein [Hypoxylon rubiginosum]